MANDVARVAAQLLAELIAVGIRCIHSAGRGVTSKYPTVIQTAKTLECVLATLPSFCMS